MKISFLYGPMVAIILFLIVFGCPGSIPAQDKPTEAVQTVYGLGSILGKSIDPVTDIHYVQLSAFAMWDYDQIWHHWAPDPLRFKVEGSIGATTRPNTRAMISVEMLALYCLNFISTPRLLPYIEGGIGVIYTDFQVTDRHTKEEQGSRISFNPLIGIGTEIKVGKDNTFFTTVRLSHVSNAGLHEENRGFNSIHLMIGRYF